LKFALENITTLIQTELNPALIQLEPPAAPVLSKYISRITAEKNIVRSMLLEEVFSCTAEKSVELLIQQNQAALINLADDLVQSINSIEPFHIGLANEKVSIFTVYHHILQCIEELLTFIEKHFNRYFNRDEKIPQSYKLLMQAEFRNNFTEFSKFYKIAGIDPALVEIMLKPLLNFVDAEKSEHVTYRQLFYLKTLQKEYSNLLLPAQNELFKINLINQLIYLNFNDHAFIDYYIQIISKDVNEAVSIFEQIEKLAWWFKTVKQVRTRPDTAYKLKDAPAKDQLLTWIEFEMAFLEKKQQLILEMPPQHDSFDQPLVNVITAFSVRQVALFARLLIDLEYIKTDNQREMLKALTQVLHTEKTKNISPANLRNKYYNIDEPTKNSLKVYLFKLIDQLRKY
jgi:hypothetical protein